ncbi:MAG: iron ABC transporter permease [Elusimicrobiota bacterium]|nr:iron ABC transporter permease [Elusimicrobiota bacterium]
MKVCKFYGITIALLAAGAAVSILGFGGAEGAILKMRVFKTLSAALCGGALAAAGVLLQNLLKNPLADPYILGTSSGSTLGIVIAGMLGFTYFGAGYYLFIVGGAFFASLIVCLLAYGRGRGSAVKVILAGIAVNIFLSAIVMLAMFLYRQAYFSTLSFMLGTVSERPHFVLAASGALIAAGFALALPLARACDILSLGELRAQTLGADIKKLRYGILLAVALLVGGAVGLCGAIGFVGFIVPHIARLLTGPKVRGLLFASFLLGAAFLVDMEVLNRLLFYPRQMPVGVLCALSGAPFFIWVLMRDKGEYF